MVCRCDSTANLLPNRSFGRLDQAHIVASGFIPAAEHNAFAVGTESGVRVIECIGDGQFLPVARQWGQRAARCIHERYILGVIADAQRGLNDGGEFAPARSIIRLSSILA